MLKERNTAQKKFILDYLMSVKCHPTAEKVFGELRKKLPTISQATVYRVLNNLKNNGQAITIDAKGVVHFDGDISAHAHLVCEKCGNVYDIMNFCKDCKMLKNKKYIINFYGACERCKQKCNKKQSAMIAKKK